MMMVRMPNIRNGYVPDRSVVCRPPTRPAAIQGPEDPQFR